MPPAPTTSNFAFCTIAKRSWMNDSWGPRGSGWKLCFFSCSGCYFLGGDKGVNCEPIHDYNYGYSFNFLLPVCKQDSTQPTKQRPPPKRYQTKNQHLHQHISTLLSTILIIEYHFRFGEIYLQDEVWICKTNINKNHCFCQGGSWETHPPWRKPAHHGHGRHLTQDSLHSRIPGGRHGTGARHDLRCGGSEAKKIKPDWNRPSPVTIPAWGYQPEKKSIQWIAVHGLFLFWGDFFLNQQFFSAEVLFWGEKSGHAGILVMLEDGDLGSCYVRSWSREMNHHPRLPCLRTQISNN